MARYRIRLCTLERASVSGLTPSLAWYFALRIVAKSSSPMQLTVEVLSWIAKMLSGASARWIDCHPDTCQRIYFANHTSHLDALVIWSSLPSNIRRLTRPVAAKDYWEKGAVRRHIAKNFNALLIDRKEIKVHRSPIDLMIQEAGAPTSSIRNSVYSPGI